MNKELLTLSKIRETFAEIHKDKKILKPEEKVNLADSIKANAEAFAKEVIEAKGTKYLLGDKVGQDKPAIDLNFKEAVKDFFGADLKTVLAVFGVYTHKDTLESMATKLGYKGGLTTEKVNNILAQYSGYSWDTFAGFTTRNEFDEPLLRIFFPELILQAIQESYNIGGKWQGWVAGMQSVGSLQGQLPKIKEGNAMVVKVSEGARIPYGNLDLGSKPFKLFKVGVGLKLTYEIVRTVSIDLLGIFLSEVNVQMNRQKDTYALDILINGDEAGGAASADVIGVNNANVWTEKDILRATTRLGIMGRPLDAMIVSEEEGLELLAKRETQYYLVPPVLDDFPTLKQNLSYNFPPANQIVILSKDLCMLALKFGTTLVEQERDIETQHMKTVITEHIAFIILRRDARVVLDNSVLFSSVGWDSFMDISTLQGAGFNAA